MARISFMISAAAFFLACFVGGDPLLLDAGWVAIQTFYAFLWMVVYVAFVGASQIMEDTFTLKDTMNPFRVGGFPVRAASILLCSLLFVMMSAWDMGNSYMLLKGVDYAFWICGHYFMACNPLPPHEAKVVVWLTAAKRMLEAGPVGQPQSVPLPR